VLIFTFLCIYLFIYLSFIRFSFPIALFLCYSFFSLLDELQRTYAEYVKNTNNAKVFAKLGLSVSVKNPRLEADMIEVCMECFGENE
jgi:hypothetical protein